MNEYLVRMDHCGDYWELHVENVGVTQSFGLDDAEGMVRDLIARRMETGTEPIVLRWTMRERPHP